MTEIIPNGVVCSCHAPIIDSCIADPKMTQWGLATIPVQKYSHTHMLSKAHDITEKYNQVTWSTIYCIVLFRAYHCLANIHSEQCTQAVICMYDCFIETMYG